VFKKNVRNWSGNSKSDVRGRGGGEKRKIQRKKGRDRFSTGTSQKKGCKLTNPRSKNDQ